MASQLDDLQTLINLARGVGPEIAAMLEMNQAVKTSLAEISSVLADMLEMKVKEAADEAKPEAPEPPETGEVLIAEAINGLAAKLGNEKEDQPQPINITVPPAQVTVVTGESSGKVRIEFERSRTMPGNPIMAAILTRM
jgi:hypothetical protein